MKVGQILITHFIQIHCLFAISLHYDATNHYYDDLLISISPDVQGEKIFYTYYIFHVQTLQGHKVMGSKGQ